MFDKLLFSLLYKETNTYFERLPYAYFERII